MNDPIDLRCRIATKEELDAINQYEDAFNAECGLAIGWVFKTVGWRDEQLAQRIKGVPATTWRNYRLASYRKNRSIHVIAALAWVSQVSMSAMYYGKNIQKYWAGVDHSVIEAVVHSGLLPLDLFEAYTKSISRAVGKEVLESDEISRAFSELEQYEEVDFLAPDALNIDDFRQDYYKSVAVSLRNIRDCNDFSREQMAHIFDVSFNRYLSFENPDSDTRVPLFLGVRLKQGFPGLNTVDFTRHMTAFPGFSSARIVQQLRENLVIGLLKNLDDKAKSRCARLAREMSSFHLKHTG